MSAASIAVLGLGATCAYLGLSQTGVRQVRGTDNRRPAIAKRPRPTIRHVITRESGSSMRVNLATGAERPIVVVTETWAEDIPGKATGRMLTESRIEGRLTSRIQSVYCTGYRRPAKFPRGGCVSGLSPLGTAKQYRQFVKHGLMHEDGTDVVRGRAVIWLEATEKVSRREAYPSVAVDAHSYTPLRIRYSTDRQLDRQVDLLRMDAVPVGSVKFAKRPDVLYPPHFGPTGMQIGTRVISSLARATRVLGRRPLWLGSRFLGHPVASPEVVRRRVDLHPFAVVPGPRILLAPFVRVRYLGGGRDAFLRIDQVTGRRAAFRTFGSLGPPKGYVDILGTEHRSGSQWAVTFGRLRRGNVFVQLRSQSRAALIAAATALRPMPATR